MVVKSAVVFGHKYLEPSYCGNRIDDPEIFLYVTYQHFCVCLVRFG